MSTKRLQVLKFGAKFKLQEELNGLGSICGAVKGDDRLKKRNIFNLASVIHCSSRWSLAYIVYGCYCGLGGEGWPRDNTDWCCFYHDCCYRRAESAGCNPKFEYYHWFCQNGIPKCANFFNICQKKACDCDVELSKCLKQRTYHMRYALWPDFLCGKEHPKC
ncbi:phospholipase A2-like [Narcine bancroftii]|uniref:phospholipase A2-like n=1 Tax=Narcine bancroftii TaxID=1343680 RepID=UPI0038310A29